MAQVDDRTMSAAVRTRRRAAIARDQHESAFASILADLVERVPGARAAALRGPRRARPWTTAGQLDPFAMRLAAAHWRIVLDELNRQRSFRSSAG